MGFRSTFVGSDYNITWPEWFISKYQDSVHFDRVLASKRECKTYSVWLDLDKDIQKALEEAGLWKYYSLAYELVYLHECGGITRVQIDKDRIQYSEPETWKKVDNVTHWYCYNCSKVEQVCADS